jgi:hypothetical protein
MKSMRSRRPLVLAMPRLLAQSSCWRRSLIPRLQYASEAQLPLGTRLELEARGQTARQYTQCWHVHKIIQSAILLRAQPSSEARSARLDTVRTFSGQRPALGNRTAADFRLRNNRQATVTTKVSRRDRPEVPAILRVEREAPSPRSPSWSSESGGIVSASGWSFEVTSSILTQRRPRATQVP